MHPCEEKKYDCRDFLPVPSKLIIGFACRVADVIDKKIDVISKKIDYHSHVKFS